jgi:hypothetical protein
MRIGRWLLSPLRLIFVLFAAQAAFWWVAMPEIPTVSTAAPRYNSDSALMLFLLLFALLLAGTWIGMRLAGPLPRRQIATLAWIAPSQIRVLKQLAYWATALSLIGYIVYTRMIWLNPKVIAEAAAAGDIAGAGNLAQSSTIGGLTSLTNLFTVPTAVWALLAFHSQIPAADRRRAKRWLLAIGIVATLHALLLSSRSYFLWYLMTVLGAYLLLRGQNKRVRARTVLLGFMLLVLIFWAGATLRDGGRYAYRTGANLFDADTQRYVWDVMVQGYLAADFNNAMVVLDSQPSMQFVSTTMFRKTGSTSYTELPGWRGYFGTVNTLALWWFDLGWWSTLMALIVGAWLGYSYILARRSAPQLGFLSLFYLISYAGVTSLVRLNYFALSYFVLPALFLFGFRFIAKSQTRKRRARLIIPEQPYLR